MKEDTETKELKMKIIIVAHGLVAQSWLNDTYTFGCIAFCIYISAWSTVWSIFMALMLAVTFLGRSLRQIADFSTFYSYKDLYEWAGRKLRDENE